LLNGTFNICQSFNNIEIVKRFAVTTQDVRTLDDTELSFIAKPRKSDGCQMPQEALDGLIYPQGNIEEEQSVCIICVGLTMSKLRSCDGLNRRFQNEGEI
jgi:hypothetical protein